MINKWGKARLAWAFVLLIVTVLRLAVVYDEPLIVRAAHDHDDRMFVEQAESILEGNWLGTYSAYTNMKGPGYPLWLAANAYFGIPVLFAQQILYVAASALACIALAWVIPSFPFRAVVYILLIWSPSSYDGWIFILQRVGAYQPGTLLVFGAAIGTLGAVSQSLFRLLCWAIVCGLATGWLWIMREEGFWLIPGMSILLALGFIRILVVKPERRVIRALLLVIPALITAGCVHAVCYKNWAYYRAYQITDFKSQPFKRAYGALIRAGEPAAREYLPLPNERRDAVYAVSPTLQTVREPLERIRRRIPSEPTRFDLHTAWIGMALRLAAGRAGHYGSHAGAMRFYDNVAQEINAACDEGRLACGPYRESYLTPWRADYSRRIVSTFGRAVREFATFNYQPRFENYSRLTPETSALFARITNTRFAPGGGRSLFREDPDTLRNEPPPLTERIRYGIRRIYSMVLPTAAAFAIVCAIAGFVRDVRKRRIPYVTILLASLFGSVAGKLIMQSYVELTATFGLFGRYLLPLYPVFFIGMALAIAHPFGKTRFDDASSVSGSTRS